MEGSRRYSDITLLRVFAMISIVLAHTICTPFIYHSDYYSIINSHILVILTNIFRTGVIVFVMISGALFLRPEKELSIKKLLCKNVLRIVLGIIIFGIVFSLMELVFTAHSFSIKMIFEAILLTLQNKSWGHMWYLYMLVGLYLITPILKAFINNSSDSEILYLLIILFIFNLFFPFINNLCNIQLGFTIPFSGKYIFFYVLGYVIYSKKVVFNTITSVIFLSIGVIVMIIQPLCLHAEIDVKSVVYIDKFGLCELCNLIPVAFFCLVANANNIRDSKIFIFLSEQSYGVYIFHPVMLNFIYKVIKLPARCFQGIYLFFSWIIICLVTILFSVLITYLLRRIPIVKKWLL